jgi:hypothetical protein
MYANAIQSGYTLKKSDTSASVGLSLLGSVSLPIRSNSDAMVKVSSETIQSNAFYNGFFDSVARFVSTMIKTEPVPAAAVTTTTLPSRAHLITAPALAPAASAAAVASAAVTTEPAAEAAKAATQATPNAAPADEPTPAPQSTSTPGEAAPQ